MVEVSEPLIGVISAVIGIVFGSAGTYWANSSVQKKSLQITRLHETQREKRKCCSDFLSEVNRLIIQSMEEKVSNPTAMTVLSGFYSNIQLICSDDTIKRANSLFELILDAHEQRESESEKSFPELRDEFINAARREIENT